MNHRAKKRLGQHFLHDPIVISRIIRLIDPVENDQLLEIGPGPGVLTTQLLEHVPHLYAVELDNDMITALTAAFSPQQLTLFHSDILKFDLARLALDNGKLKVVGNLPYNISTPIIFHLLKWIKHIDVMHFMLQKEVVDRMCAGPGSKNYGRLSVMLQYHCHVESGFTIGPGAFKPKPKVHSRMVSLIPLAQPEHPAIDNSDLAIIVKAAFEQRRKMIRRSLLNHLTSEEIETTHINPDKRPEQLSLENFVALANCWSTKKASAD